MVFAASGVLPSTTTTMCTVPLKIRSNAVVGGAGVYPKSHTCATATGANAAVCTATPGHIMVTGPWASAAPASSPSLSLNLLLAADGPTPDAVLAATAKSTKEGLTTFREVPPVSVRSLVTERASGEAHQLLLRQPNSADALLERYVVAEYRSVRERDAALESARRDRQVRAVSVNEAFAPGGTVEDNVRGDKSAAKGATVAYEQYHLSMLRVPAAWSVAGGWGLIGVPDNGIDPDHPELRTFTGLDSLSGAFVPAGNYLPALSRNVAGAGQPLTNLHEGQKSLRPPELVHLNCDPNNTGYLTPETAGHGTHVAGIVAANAADDVGSSGTCRNCGLAVRKVSIVTCNPIGNDEYAAYPEQMTSAIADAIKDLRRVGVQVINASFGSAQRYCTSYEDNGSATPDLMCIALGAAIEDDILVVAATGNNLVRVNFPAADNSVLAAGGVDLANQHWDFRRLDGGLSNCPYHDPYTAPASEIDCGSNFNGSAFGREARRRVELVSPAVSIRSAFYPGWTWGDRIGCGDGFGAGPSNDGSGVCTGTSMSAPAIAGIAGLLRSTNPMLKVGNPYIPTPYGIRNLLRETTERTRGGLAWDWYVGFGTVDAGAALNKVLGPRAGHPDTQPCHTVVPPAQHGSQRLCGGGHPADGHCFGAATALQPLQDDPHGNRVHRRQGGARLRRVPQHFGRRAQSCGTCPDDRVVHGPRCADSGALVPARQGGPWEQSRPHPVDLGVSRAVGGRLGIFVHGPTRFCVSTLHTVTDLQPAHRHGSPSSQMQDVSKRLHGVSGIGADGI